MRKLFLFTLGALLSAPLLAQTPTPPPAPSAPPPDLPVKPGPPEVNGSPPSDTKPDASGSVREDRTSLGATGNKDTKSGKLRARSTSQKNDFANWDVDGDGKLTQDEVKGAADLEGGFKAADKDGNGTLSHGEYEQAIHAKAPKSPAPPKG